MKQRFRIGISPCPNDTFAFHALITGAVELPFEAEFVIKDVEELNRLVLSGGLDISKVSFHLAGRVLADYMILNSGAALGRGCGPLLIAGSRLDPRLLQGERIAIPGRNTTAALLLKLFLSELGMDIDTLDQSLEEMLFSKIPDAVASGRVRAGLIIHESRFTYCEKGLVELEDLGRWWEETTGMPIPLGCIVGSRRLGPGLLARLDAALEKSIEAAHDRPGPAMDFAARYAQEISPDVMSKHIALYVNSFTTDMGQEGRAAVRTLFKRAHEAGILPAESPGAPFDDQDGIGSIFVE